jgi:hypothetical protein
MPFELTTPTAATLKSVTPRVETHDDDKVSAISLGLSITGPNTILDLLDGGKLRNALYMPVPDQAQLPGVEPSTPLLRASKIDILHLAGKLEGWTATFEHGIDEAGAIVLGYCCIDKFRVRPMEGGTVELLFRIGTNDIDEAEGGALFGKLGQMVMMTLKAPVITADTPVIDGTNEAFERDHPGAGDPDAGGLFDDLLPRDGDIVSDMVNDSGEILSNAGDDEAAEFEDGARNAIEAAGVKPRGRGGKRVSVE